MPKLPLVLGHQIVGTVESVGEGEARFALGERVGVPWLGWTCGECRYCLSGRENLCERARFTGYDIDGGFAEPAVADQRFCFPIPARLSRTTGRAAALRRADRLPRPAACRGGERLGLYGFGAAAHILCQVAACPGRARLRLHPGWRRRGPGVRARTGRRVGGGVGGPGPEPLDAAIIFAPAGELVPEALRAP